jgi:hypothetical protein
MCYNQRQKDISKFVKDIEENHVIEYEINYQLLEAYENSYQNDEEQIESYLENNFYNDVGANDVDSNCVGQKRKFY